MEPDFFLIQDKIMAVHLYLWTISTPSSLKITGFVGRAAKFSNKKIACKFQSAQGVFLKSRNLDQKNEVVIPLEKNEIWAIY